MDGYQYHPLWMNPKDAEARGIKHGDVVTIFNERGKVLPERMSPSASCPGSWDSTMGPSTTRSCRASSTGAELINTIVPRNTTSKNAPGMAVSGFLAEVEKADLEALRAKYPEPFARVCHPTAGQCLAGVLMKGGE